MQSVGNLNMMNAYDFQFSNLLLRALPSGALYVPAHKLLCVSDLHLGKSDRIARRSGTLVPPYENMATLAKLDADIAQTQAETIVCLGDSFDDLKAVDALATDDKATLTRMQAGRRWIWIEGNHDPGPLDTGGTHLAELPLHPLLFRHIAQEKQSGEVSGHYHPKARLSTKGGSITRSCFLIDGDRVIMPAFGTYTGGLHANELVLSKLMREEALAVLTGPFPAPIPMPR